MDDSRKLVFYIVRELSENISKDLSEFIYHLKNSYIFIDIIQTSPTTATLSGNATYKSEIEHQVNNKPSIFKNYSFCLKFTLSQEDYHTFNKLRDYLSNKKDNYRIYSNQLHTYLPKDTDLVSLEFGSVNIKTFEILKRFSLLPIFYHQENNLYYSLNIQDKSIHIINPFLLEYIYDKNIPEEKLPELSYQVAKNLNIFSALFDKDLIPIDFYQYYQKSTKIINESQFDINRQFRKVFVKPYIFEFQPEHGNFYTYAGKDGGSLLRMDKIRPGESLDKTITRVVKDDLKISNDYLAALVSRNIEFDRDKDGLLTPRLVVFVYVEKINDKNWALQMSQTGWKSVSGKTPKINQNPDFNKIN